MNRGYISLGSNMGNRLHMLQRAAGLLNAHSKVEVDGISSVYETEPVGFTDQQAFLNMVITVKTSLSSLELLKVCQVIEQQLHRERLVRWGPRTIDLDILLYNQDNMETEELTIPHPRMYERAFVLVPLLIMEPDLQDPRSGRLFKELVRAAEGDVQLYRTYPNLTVFLNASE
ncbi:2-amino-4-hydroxy-6-hydroxymethyldihydropteridine diphosphokinase [Planococcus lenghuensis]|uniref:2-amino-4-hydroxy-6-hydroxymethyldihydropteridine diphosphokinase n=1 Tax=Planococcus lenghuensis TaxID=2213202 RepID=A0A1Q2KUA6_9BACL|nr:2-amino-4-hydroxy-6-hydroxymethyldihydropteridine diphosphokinase [Planococcus lenghuensis]AQQ51733.1 2-amino-4-hydroxy-6-hydroxymethyldihydropteridine diphosphokinase [Planococcus lenghuensis]